MQHYYNGQITALMWIETTFGIKIAMYFDDIGSPMYSYKLNLYWLV